MYYIIIHTFKGQETIHSLHDTAVKAAELLDMLNAPYIAGTSTSAYRLELFTQMPTHIKIYVTDESYSQFFIQRGINYTPANSCVEYEDYYEIAMHSWYMRINKKTLEVTSNLRDVDVFEKMNDRWAVVY